MRRASFLLTAVGLLLLLCRGTSVIGVGLEGEAAVPRFEQVAPGLYRGGQPTPAGFRYLKWRGIRTVINLRAENGERATVEELGLKYVHIPLSAWDPVSEQALQTFLKTVNDPASQPVFVHCRHGRDRTGAMIGFYRIAVQGWDASRAYEDARMHGMRWWYRSLRRQLYDIAGSSRLEGRLLTR